MPELTCPICKCEFPNQATLDWHAFYKEMPTIRRTKYPLEEGEKESDYDDYAKPIVNRCWCGEELTMLNYDRHLAEHGGAFAHYHAANLGIKP